ncbi:MAG TPA: RsmB/NOP family class I SAM-dependent RNA methyltransferase [Victivallales bacterium]|nr:RsmB/NOP family class I SAM-dependent RNA methyltransferase [Victivallales bacterium]HPO91439.1 RsmB/NOP family class I SAM-dependent RNA methyltransferase [Victivallales bacterium]HRR06525.1 RsmB/NOP family class I SAM-dependent RNA methyltransferase [Victivallales bacterium]HRR29351.1 RsmB/NOP family class I SAM-dependent RNA methyltransferase [Victivallales bacterium]HRU02285.1 RsmB/NOP family class I SAM-dependent RNA methyltransferase [Victivallales bacterium]
MHLKQKQRNTLLREQKEIASSLISELAKGYPADKSLASELKKRKYLGSRDRRFISENIFSLFRWWGWISIIIQIPNIHQLVNNKRKLDESLFLAEEIRKILNQTGTTSNLHEIAKIISSQFKIQNLIPESLFPNFFKQALSPMINFAKISMVFQSRPPIWLRVEKNKKQHLIKTLIKLNAVYEKSDILPEAIKILKFEKSLYELSEFKKGFFEIQDFSSQMVATIANPKEGEKWLDVCAGAGGKTLHLADLMKNKGSITAIDKDEKKISELKRRAKRHKFSNIHPIVADATKINSRRKYFYDGIIVDAPCSCSGTWRRNPDARWRLREKDLEDFHSLQLQILSTSAKSLKRNGYLIYATCSVFHNENEKIVENFLKQNKDFEIADFENPINKIPCSGYFYVDPSVCDSDSMFIAKFRRH